MNRWWCMDCRMTVEMDRHGRCGICESEAVILAEPTNDLNDSASAVKMDSPTSQVCA